MYRFQFLGNSKFWTLIESSSVVYAGRFEKINSLTSRGTSHGYVRPNQTTILLLNTKDSEAHTFLSENSSHVLQKYCTMGWKAINLLYVKQKWIY